MKSKEEIEQLAEQEFGLNERNIDEFNAYKKGYIQCQQDMAKELEQVDIICPKCQGINEYFIEKNGDYKCAYTDCENKFKQTRLI